MNKLSFLTTDESRRLRLIISQRLQYVENQLEFYNTKCPRSSGSDLIANTYLKEHKELLSIKEKITGGIYES